MLSFRSAMRRLSKWLVLRLLLAPCYWLCCLCPVRPGLVVLADGHQNSMPYSMTAIAARLRQHSELDVREYFRDYSFCGALRGLRVMLHFLPLYAQAQYVFVCDYFLPTACAKRNGTTLIQLWHSGGLMKKLAQDSPDDAKGFVRGMYDTTDVFTASSPLVSDVLSQAIGLERSRFSEAGVTRMDLLYDEERTDSLRLRLARAYPELSGKKLILWAPTFRGSAQDGRLIGVEEILQLRKELPETYALIIKTHRYTDLGINDLPDFSSDELFPLADALITDYSSIYFDYLFFRRPIILFAPDLEDYRNNRGLYVDYRSIPGYFAENGEQLWAAVTQMDQWADAAYLSRLDALWAQQMGYCDGHSCEKLLRQLGLEG